MFKSIMKFVYTDNLEFTINFWKHRRLILILICSVKSVALQAFRFPGHARNFKN